MSIFTFFELFCAACRMTQRKGRCRSVCTAIGLVMRMSSACKPCGPAPGAGQMPTSAATRHSTTALKLPPSRTAARMCTQTQGQAASE